MIAKDAEDAAELIDQLLKERSVIDLDDTVIIPALSLAEEGRHTGLLDSTTETYFFWRTRVT